MLYGSECWPLKVDDVNRLRRSERSMLRWICRLKSSEHVALEKIYQRLHITPLDVTLRERRLRWFGHVKRSESWTKKSLELVVNGTARRGRPRKTWFATIMEDMKAWNIKSEDACCRTRWRSELRAAVKKHTRASHGDMLIGQ